jgi:hypothetical protein
MDDVKTIYMVQPYRVGSKHGKSLVIVIPAKVVKKYSINTSTIFALTGDDNTKTITLQNVSKMNNASDIPNQKGGYLDESDRMP